MARELIEAIIDGRNFQVAAMDPFKSLRLLTRLTKLLGPAIEPAFKDATLDTDAAELAGQVVGALADSLDEQLVDQTARDLLGQVLLNGVKLQPELEFAGEVPLMFKVMAKVLEVEYGGFLPFVRSLQSKGQQAKASKVSQTT